MIVKVMIKRKIKEGKAREVFALLNKSRSDAMNQKGYITGETLINHDNPREILVISMWQDRVLQQLMSSLTMERLHDSELKVAADQDAFTTAELIDRLTKSIFSEVDNAPSGDFTTRKPAVSSLRRNLQRIYVKRLANLALGETGAPQDCQTIAYVALEDLEGRLNKLLATDAKLDPYTRAHLKETASRVHKVLDSKLEISRP